MDAYMDSHGARLEQFAQMSQQIGANAADVQGGGGNTSVKLDGQLMAVKASGYLLSDIRPDKAYAVLDYSKLRDFYLKTDPAELLDVEKAGAQAARENVVPVPGLTPLRPSVEAGFHSLLDDFVIHSHSVFANLAACSGDPEREMARALQGAPFAAAFVPYVDPGARLTFTIRDILNRAQQETGRRPQVLLMQNHGLIAHAHSAQEALRLHEEAKDYFRKAYQVQEADYPQVVLRDTPEGCKTDIPWLHERLRGDAYPDRVLMEEPLYPDQMVFFEGTLGQTAVIDRDSGVVNFQMNKQAALAIAQTLCAVVLIRQTLAERGLAVQPMGAAARDFIGGWESEKYRKQLNQGRA